MLKQGMLIVDVVKWSSDQSVTVCAEEVEDLQTGNIHTAAHPVATLLFSSDSEITNSNITVVGDIPAPITARHNTS